MLRALLGAERRDSFGGMTTSRLFSFCAVAIALCAALAAGLASAAPDAAAPQPRYGGTLVVAAGDPGILTTM